MMCIDAPHSSPSPIEGTAISIFGAVNAADPMVQASFILDNNTAQSFNPDKPTSDTMFNQQIYSIDSLEPGTHTLKGTLQNSGPLNIDYFVVQPVSSPTPSPTPSSSPSPKASNPSSGPRKVPVGAIAGGVVGGLAFLMLVAVLIWWLTRRRRRLQNQKEREETPTPLDITGVEPEARSRDGETKSSSLPSDTTLPTLSTLPSAAVSTRDLPPQTDTPGLTTSLSSGVSTLDSGIRFNEEGVALFPPKYSVA